MAYDVFISYSRRDSDVADKICAALDDADISYFIDREGISGGKRFPAVLADAILQSKVFLFLASENSYASMYTRKEVTFALNEKDDEAILPYIIDGSTMPGDLRFLFSDINWRTIGNCPVGKALCDDLRALMGNPAQPGKMLPEDTLETARELYDDDKYQQALDLCLPLAEAGNADAANLVASIYDTIDYDYNDSDLSLKWHMRAAELGNIDSLLVMGDLYDYGDEVEKDRTKATMMYRRAAEAGSARGIGLYAKKLYYGDGTATDIPKAVELFKKGAAAGDELSKQYIQRISQRSFDKRMYFYDTFAIAEYEAYKGNKDAAIKWYRHGAEAGSLCCMYRLTRQDIEPNERIKWDKILAEKGVYEDLSKDFEKVKDDDMPGWIDPPRLTMDDIMKL